MFEKEKLLGTSNFSFSHTVFKRHVLQTRKNQRLFGKGLMTLLKNMEKGKGKNRCQIAFSLLDYQGFFYRAAKLGKNVSI